MPTTYMLLILMTAGQQIQMFQGFQTRKACELVLEQVKPIFKPHAIGCVEIKPDAGK